MPNILNIAIILAAGSGCRAVSTAAKNWQQQPKQFWPLSGQPLWQHSWLRYALHPAIHKVCLVWPAEYLEFGRKQIEILAAQTAQATTTYSIAGGQQRSSSSSIALDFCSQWQAPQYRVQVLIHDAARPLVSHRMIDETLAQLQTANAVICAIPAQDSLLQKQSAPSNQSEKVAKILDRSRIMRSQTPQSFELQTLRRAFALHQQKQEIEPTDDISLVKHYLPTEDIAIVAGEISNIKLTEAADLRLLEYFLNTMGTLGE